MEDVGGRERNSPQEWGREATCESGQGGVNRVGVWEGRRGEVRGDLLKWEPFSGSNLGKVRRTRKSDETGAKTRSHQILGRGGGRETLP